MDEQRKYASRHLLYESMLPIRGLGWLCWGWWRVWGPLHWRREGPRVRCAGAVAGWLQDLALYSSVGFRGFNEEWFWRDFESVRSRYPDMGLERYREAFERRAA